MDKFELVSKFEPTGDQPEAIDRLVEGLEKGDKEQVLLGVTVVVKHLQWLML